MQLCSVDVYSFCFDLEDILASNFLVFFFSSSSWIPFYIKYILQKMLDQDESRKLKQQIGFKNSLIFGSQVLERKLRILMFSSSSSNVFPRPRRWFTIESFNLRRKFLTLELFFLLLHDDAWCTYEKIKTKMQHTIQQSIQMSLKKVVLDRVASE